MNAVADLAELELAAEGEYKFLPLSETLTYVLLAVRENQPCSGAEIQRGVLALSDGHVAPAAGNLYPMLVRLVDDGLLARNDSGGIAYRITELGHRTFDAMIRRLEHLVSMAHKREPQPSAHAAELDASRPDDLRKLGWFVGIHNDYAVKGVPFTYWSLNHPASGRFLKGEGRTDAEALDQIREQLRAEELAQMELTPVRDPLEWTDPAWRQRYRGGCLVSGPGRGDCMHFIGLPPDELADEWDEYGYPREWCQGCWNSFQKNVRAHGPDATEVAAARRRWLETHPDYRQATVSS